MKSKKAAFFSISVSVIAHMLLFTCATTVRIPGIHAVLERSKRLFNIAALDKEMPKKQLNKRGLTHIQSLKFESPVFSEKIASSFNTDEKRVKKPDLAPQEEPDAEQLSASRPDEIEALLEEGMGRAQEHRRGTREEIVAVTPANRPAVIRPEDARRELILPAEFFSAMPGFTPSAADRLINPSRKDASGLLPKEYRPALKRSADVSDLNEYLVCGLSVYEDPLDGQKYFKISIRAGKDAQAFPRLPKEIVFLVDCSLSTQIKRLEEFKKGLRYCLQHLNPDDYFNIAAFKEKIEWFRPRSVRPEHASIQEALRFVSRLRAGAGTDAYRALYESIKKKQAIVPSYIILFSDGRPTQGETDPRKIIHEISALNDGRRPIFAFSGGLRVNRYFLDFISYKNRGWTEYAPRTHQVGREIAGMYEKIKDPMLLNVRYQIGGLESREIFPKILPDFYRNAAFTIFGTYSDEKEFSLRLLGDTQKETNEFIVAGSFADAREGSSDIARGWAFNKIYHLIGLLEYGRENAELLEQIRALCKKFNINIPYAEGLER